MKIRKKICSRCGEEKHIWKNHEGEKYCKPCWHKIKFLKEKPKRKGGKPVRQKSNKQAELDRMYTQLRRRFMERQPMCQAALPGCTHNATDVHHTRGRGRWYLVVSSWMAVCRTCHNHIHHIDPKGAREAGFLE